MDKHAIIKLKKEGQSNRAVARLTGADRKTVSKYWEEYKRLNTELKKVDSKVIVQIQEQITSEPKYKSTNRNPRKYTDEINTRLDELLLNESKKDKLLGSHKQKLTRIQITDILKGEGFDISYSTISNRIKEKLSYTKECFIKQDYEYGDRLEYDFGEVKLVIDNEVSKYYMAVLSSPAGNFRWAYLYKNQKKDVFMDSHVKFFEMSKGVYREVVYDNMRNVVSKFIGKNEKELNEDLVKMSIYYGFDINVTNCFKGNEKGHVEGSVKIIRNKVFAENYKFNSFEDAQEYLNSQLIKMNECSNFEEEKSQLLAYKPMLELAEISQNDVNKYSFIRVDNNFYSVPDYLIGKKVIVKKYFNKIQVFSNTHFVCEHKKIDGTDKISIEINHYLKTLLKKPGALKNSYALKSSPKLKSIYDKYFISNPKQFIDILLKNKEKNHNELIDILKAYITESTNMAPISTVNASTDINESTKSQLLKYSQLQKEFEV